MLGVLQNSVCACVCLCVRARVDSHAGRHTEELLQYYSFFRQRLFTDAEPAYLRRYVHSLPSPAPQGAIGSGCLLARSDLLKSWSV